MKLTLVCFENKQPMREALELRVNIVTDCHMKRKWVFIIVIIIIIIIMHLSSIGIY